MTTENVCPHKMTYTGSLSFLGAQAEGTKEGRKSMSLGKGNSKEAFLETNSV